MGFNENELIYLYQLEKYDWIKQHLFVKYKERLKSISLHVFGKYNFVPLESSDLDVIQYVTFSKCLSNFKEEYLKTFANYLFQRCTWDVHNYIKKFISKKHQILNFASSLDNSFFDVSDKNFNYIIDPQNNHKKNFIKKNLHILSNMEKEIFGYKMLGYKYKEIEEITNLSYKQIDNCLQRAINKLRDCWKLNIH
ncbi:hypothetical protein [Spiroplasma endosymbiont of Amphibalanus improvisus]|uniref:hypothetical protein n=1 Tax=Spiroplasma endosymbiont of Amphibalanus improvisus TaxID=3066327 RepID=UPI00313D41B7